LRIPRVLTALFGLMALAALLVVGYVVSRPRGPVLVEAGFQPEVITPNADGEDDLTEITYRIRRQARVSIYLEDDSGQRHMFRDDELRIRGDYRVLFGGVVDGFLLEDEDVAGEVVKRLLPDGDYIWVIETEDVLTGRTDRLSGPLTIAAGDPVLPELIDFSVAPPVFTPNQDGLTDLVRIDAYVPKEADLTVYLVDDAGNRYFIPESQLGRKPGEEGRHTFEWDGGVDLGRNPPPDGTYQVLAEAVDAEGQRVRRESEVTIQFGGMPLAEIVGQPVGDTVNFSAETVIVGDVLTFELTVENYGDAPIRTTGPAPGYVYEQGETFASSGYYEESGAWRVGIHCQTCLTDYPWRWALGTPETLTAIETGDEVEYYLMPGERAVVTGGVRLTNIIKARNPQQFWAGLIHEDVEIVDQAVDPHWIEIVPAVLTPGEDAVGQ
jgi:hypothetical protein